MPQSGFPWGILGTGNHLYVVGGSAKLGTFLDSNLNFSPIPAGGFSTQVQFNSGGVLAGSTSLTWDGKHLYINGVIAAVLTNIPPSYVPLITTPVEASGDVGEVQYSDGLGGFVSDRTLTYDSLDGLYVETSITAGDSLSVVRQITAADDLEFTNYAKGFIMHSPNGTRYRVTIDNTGALNSTAI